jgi:hypothetical protein
LEKGEIRERRFENAQYSRGGFSNLVAFDAPRADASRPMNVSDLRVAGP